MTSPISGIRQLEDLGDVSGKRVLVRCDLDVPIANGMIVDDFRIRACVPTLQWLVAHGALVTVCGHIGRPGGKVVPELSMAPVRERLEALVPGIEVRENLRFDPREEANDPAFVAELIDGFDYYVNEVFGVSHRKHASIVGPPQFLPSAAGRNVFREVEVIGSILDQPTLPFIAVVGGAKVSDKIGVLRALAQRADLVLIGGAMALTFLASGHELGDSMVETSHLAEARELLNAFPNLVLPEDLLVEDANGKVETRGLDLAPGERAFDIGPRTAITYSDHIAQSATVFWNGPMGRFEDERFASGTLGIAAAMAKSTTNSARTIVGGGDSAAAVAHFGLTNEMFHVSTGGGASLKLIEQGDLPGLEALRSANG